MNKSTAKQKPVKVVTKGKSKKAKKGKVSGSKPIAVNNLAPGVRTSQTNL